MDIWKSFEYKRACDHNPSEPFLEETTSDSYNSEGLVFDLGGRTLALHLDEGDTTVQLWCESCRAEITHVSFCVSLITFDII